VGRQWQLVSQGGLRGGKTVAACVTRWASGTGARQFEVGLYIYIFVFTVSNVSNA